MRKASLLALNSYNHVQPHWREAGPQNPQGHCVVTHQQGHTLQPSHLWPREAATPQHGALGVSQQCLGLSHAGDTPPAQAPAPEGLTLVLRPGAQLPQGPWCGGQGSRGSHVTCNGTQGTLTADHLLAEGVVTMSITEVLEATARTLPTLSSVWSGSGWRSQCPNSTPGS